MTRWSQRTRERGASSGKGAATGTVEASKYIQSDICNLLLPLMCSFGQASAVHFIGISERPVRAEGRRLQPCRKLSQQVQPSFPRASVLFKYIPDYSWTWEWAVAISHEEIPPYRYLKHLRVDHM